MKKILILLCGLLMISATAAAQGIEPDETTLVQAGMDVPRFTVEMLDGTHVDIADLKGKVVLVNFWATWCRFCVAELAVVEAGIMERFKDTDLVFIAISRGETKATVEKFMKQKGYTFPVGLDPDETIFNKFATTGIPRNFVIGRDGKIAMASKGYSPEIFAELTEFIEKIL